MVWSLNYYFMIGSISILVRNNFLLHVNRTGLICPWVTNDVTLTASEAIGPQRAWNWSQNIARIAEISNFVDMSLSTRITGDANTVTSQLVLRNSMISSTSNLLAERIWHIKSSVRYKMFVQVVRVSCEAWAETKQLITSSNSVKWVATSGYTLAFIQGKTIANEVIATEYRESNWYW